MYSIETSNLFKIDIQTIYNFIMEEYDSPLAADNLIIHLKDKLNQLKEKPFSRAIVKDTVLASKGYRIIQIKNYLLFYKVDEKSKIVKLHRFLHGSRDWVNILKEDYGKEE